METTAILLIAPKWLLGLLGLVSRSSVMSYILVAAWRTASFPISRVR